MLRMGNNLQKKYTENLGVRNVFISKSFSYFQADIDSLISSEACAAYYLKNRDSKLNLNTIENDKIRFDIPLLTDACFHI